MGKVYACADLHGNYKLWCKIKEYLKEDDFLYFLGDACDRGSEGLLIIKEMLQFNREKRRLKYLLGNHEDFIIKSGISDGDIRDIDQAIWLTNGGKSTMKDFYSLSHESQRWFIRRLKELDRAVIYLNNKGQKIFMCHAGTDPNKTEQEWKDVFGVRDAFLWNRLHIGHGWPYKDAYKDVYIVHGHTPVNSAKEILYNGVYTEDEKVKILKYAGGHKIDIDLGTPFSKRIALLDLDTLEPIYFEED